jgi:hypothetical protein
MLGTRTHLGVKTPHAQALDKTAAEYVREAESQRLRESIARRQVEMIEKGMAAEPVPLYGRSRAEPPRGQPAAAVPVGVSDAGKLAVRIIDPQFLKANAATLQMCVERLAEGVDPRQLVTGALQEVAANLTEMAKQCTQSSRT